MIILGFGNQKNDYLTDIAICCGGRIFGNKVEDLKLEDVQLSDLGSVSFKKLNFRQSCLKVESQITFTVLHAAIRSRLK